ncbi:zinc finger protein 502-like [Cylas formicarius]|uniref:zinc finger protein 502-like n=1 Tax=Cylas formicarius TaxID=197179 RepID=UPI00295858A1|nr:zinc finger protein 502-like [Cylas formicarius]
MVTVRCEICCFRLRMKRSLIFHYITQHSKIQLARQLIKVCASPVFRKRSKFRRGSRPCLPKLKNQICSNEIVTRDDKSSVDLDFSFDETSWESKENQSVPNCLKNVSTRLDVEDKANVNMKPVSTSPSASSESSGMKAVPNKRKIKKKKPVKCRGKHYQIITKRKERLDEKNGKFYICNGRDINIVASDTESASETGQVFFIAPCLDAVVFCNKCGNGYNSKSALDKHMKIHETQCRVCNEFFPNEQSFKEHIQNHIFKAYVCHACNFEFPTREMLRKHFECHVEESLLETVLDMEEEYVISRTRLIDPSYRVSIDNIMRFLKDL